MSTARNQSQLAEVRDQLSVDYADGAYLNIVGNNLGLSRPVFGYNDDTWRALIKAIALQYKQVLPRFHAALSILFGPQKTQVGTLAADVAVGDKSLFVTDASRFPQLGFIVLDEGLATEETLEYSFIDYATGQVYLHTDTPAAEAHVQGDATQDAESPVSYAGTAKLLVMDSSAFPTSGFPYTGVLGRGTDAEETVEIVGVDHEERSVTLSGAPSNVHDILVPSTVQSRLSLPYGAQATYVSLVDSQQFADSGYLLIHAHTDEFTAVSGTVNDVTLSAGALSANVHVGMYLRFADDTTTVALQGVERSVSVNTANVITVGSALPAVPVAGDRFTLMQPPFTAVSGATTSVTVAANTFIADRQAGNRVVFDGNVTPALKGVFVDIAANTADTITFAGSGITAPSAGDTFRIVARTSFASNSRIDDVLSLDSPLFDLKFPEGALVERLTPGATLALAPVQVKGSSWEVYQVTPRLVEVYLPDLLQDVSDLRSASYLHTEYLSPTPTTTLSVAATAGDSYVDVVSSSAFPDVGVVALDPGGVDERVGYYKDPSVANRLQIATQTILNSFGIGVTASLYQPVHGGTTTLVGDPHNVFDTFPGPYLYSVAEPAPTGTTALTTLAELLPGPAYLVMSQIVGNTALEVNNAAAFDLAGFPYSVLVGDQTGNREVVSVLDVNLRMRAVTTVASTYTGLSGEFSVDVAALSGGGAGDAADFPDASGYRVIIGRDTANEEVVYVMGTATGPDRLLLQSELQKPHAIGEYVELLADVLTTAPLTDVHVGAVSYGQRSDGVTTNARFPEMDAADITNRERIQPLISSLDVASAVGLDSTGGRVILNYGDGHTPVRNRLSVIASWPSTTLTLTSTTEYPTAVPFKVIIAPGTPVEEWALVTNNNTGAGILTLNGGTYGTNFPHVVGTEVLWEPGPQEVLEYASIAGNTLSFSPAVVLQSDHSTNESVVDSSVSSLPRNDGFDYPLRMPADMNERVSFLFDLIRAAGVQVTIIDTR